MFINKYIQSWPWPYIYGIRNQEQIHHLQLLVTVLQQEVGIINRAEKVNILCFRDKNIFFWYLLDWNEFPRQRNGSHGLVDQRIFGWQVLHGDGTFCKWAFLFLEPVQTENWQCSSFYLPEPDLGFIDESVSLSGLLNIHKISTFPLCS